jgi:hypothetical protein
MSKRGRGILAVWLLLGLPLAVALLVGAWNYTHRPRALGSGRLSDDWGLLDVIDHLHARGVTFRAVAAERDGVFRHSAFLTRTEKTWVELTVIPKSRDRLDLWEDTVFCEQVRPEASRLEQARLWDDHCLDTGTFLFYGDRKMLVEIHDALRDRLS